MQVTVYQSDTERVVTLDVIEDFDVGTLKVLIENDLAIPPVHQLLSKGDTLLNDSKLKLDEAGIADNDFLSVVDTRGSSSTRQNPSSAANADTMNLLSQMDFSTIKVPSNNSSSSARYAQSLLNSYTGNPKTLDSLMSEDPELANAVKTRDINCILNVLDQRNQLLRNNPWSAEAQKLIEQQVKQLNIDEALHNAAECIPESFTKVLMLYISVEVNKKPMAAFVDTGAQMTIMSKKCAERCELMRLVDRRFSGIAKGVGVSTIIGKIHLAELRIGKLVFPASFVIIEDDSVDFLFGLDLLRRLQCSIDLKNNVMRLGAEEVPFLSESELLQRGTDTFL